MDPLDLSPTVLALVAAQAVPPADASSTVITRYSLDQELTILKGTMLIPKTNLPADWRDANPTKGYTDWIAEQFAEKTSWFELKQVQDDTVRRYRRVIQPGDPDQTQYPNYEDLMVNVNAKANKTELAPYALQSQLNALIGEVSDKADVALLQGYVQKTELPVVPDDGYATNTQLTNGLATKANVTDVSTLSTKLDVNIGRLDLIDDRDSNATLQPSVAVTLPSDGVFTLTTTGLIPRWEYNIGSSTRPVMLFRNGISGANPDPIPPTAPNYTVCVIKATGNQSADPGYVQQWRGAFGGWNYRLEVRAAYFDDGSNTTHPYMRLRVTNVTGGAVLAEQLFRTFTTRPANVSQNNWLIFSLPFTFPGSTPGAVTVQIANMGPDTTTGAPVNGTTFLGIAEAYLVRVI